MEKVSFGRGVSIDNCKPGMKVMAEIRDKNSSVLVIPGTVLTDKLLAKLKKHNIRTVVVFDEEAERELDSIEIKETEVEKIEKNQKENPIFNQKDIEDKYKPKVNEESNEVYHNSIKNMNTIIEELECDKDLDFGKIKETTVPIFNEIINENRILYCLKQLEKENTDLFAHSVNTAILAGLLGKWLNLDKKSIVNLITGGLLHDIGLVKIPKGLFLKRILTRDEREIYEKHPLLGYELIIKSEMNSIVKKMILAHHENCDGTGFPFKIDSENISFECKILQIADRFDEIFMKLEEEKRDIFIALKILYETHFTKLDFKCLDTFIKNMLYNHIGRYVRLNDNRIGEIMFINRLNKFAPMIKIDDEIIDLSTRKEIHIENVL